MNRATLAHPPSPHDALAVLAGRPAPFLLQSGMADANVGRFSFAGVEPSASLLARGGTIEVTDHARGRTTTRQGDVFESIREMLAERALPASDPSTPLPAGAVGFFAYDLARRIERLPSIAADDGGVPDVALSFYDTVVTWDHATGETFATGPAAEEIAAVLDGAPAAGSRLPMLLAPLRSTFTRAEYLAAVERAKKLIAAGDIFQVNLSQRFTTKVAVRGHEIYQSLIRVNPAPFAAYLAGPDGLEVLSASPERFLRTEGNLVESRPIKGTRPRSEDRERDRALARELLESEKDRAELVMIVDLIRNDVGRVAEFGSVAVPELPGLTSHPTVHHLHGTITARLAAGRDRLDLLRAAFPCGSITGAPKVRAMEIIEETEPVRRGVYTGAIGWLSDAGGMDLSVAIRTISMRDGRASFSVGGGIVADSDPAAEYEETLSKGRGLARVLGFSI